MRKQHLPLFLGIVILILFLTAALFPTAFTAYGQKETFGPWLIPSAEHLLGTNALGYDIFTELVYGTRQTLLVGVSSSTLTLLLGSVIGTLAAGKGLLGGLSNGIINVFVLLPKLVTMIVLATFLGSSSRNLILLIAAFSWVGTARNVRAKVIHLNAQPFIENCVIQGYSRRHIILRHILPNLYDVLLSRFLLGVNSCIMMESTLSFLGFGDLYYPTWGTMINFAYKRGAFLRQAYAYLLSPGVCIMLLSLSFYLISLYFEHRQAAIQENRRSYDAKGTGISVAKMRCVSWPRLRRSCGRLPRRPVCVGTVRERPDVSGRGDGVHCRDRRLRRGCHSGATVLYRRKGQSAFQSTGKECFLLLSAFGRKVLPPCFAPDTGETKEERLAWLMDGDFHEMFDVKDAPAPVPEAARIFKTVTCSLCGERFAESFAHLQNSEIVCSACYRPYTRGL